jgi:hypothetical protein
MLAEYIFITESLGVLPVTMHSLFSIMFPFSNLRISQYLVHLLQMPAFVMSPLTPVIPSNKPTSSWGRCITVQKTLCRGAVGFCVLVDLLFCFLPRSVLFLWVTASSYCLLLRRIALTLAKNKITAVWVKTRTRKIPTPLQHSVFSTGIHRILASLLLRWVLFLGSSCQSQCSSPE